MLSLDHINFISFVASSAQLMDVPLADMLGLWHWWPFCICLVDLRVCHTCRPCKRLQETVQSRNYLGRGSL